MFISPSTKPFIHLSAFSSSPCPKLRPEPLQLRMVAGQRAESEGSSKEGSPPISRPAEMKNTQVKLKREASERRRDVRLMHGDRLTTDSEKVVGGPSYSRPMPHSWVSVCMCVAPRANFYRTHDLRWRKHANTLLCAKNKPGESR